MLAKGSAELVHVPVVAIRAIRGTEQAALDNRLVQMPDYLFGTGFPAVQQCDWYNTARESKWHPPQEKSFSAEDAWWRKHKKSE